MALLDGILARCRSLAGIDYPRKAMQSFVRVPLIIILLPVLTVSSVSHQLIGKSRQLRYLLPRVRSRQRLGGKDSILKTQA